MKLLDKIKDLFMEEEEETEDLEIEEEEKEEYKEPTRNVLPKVMRDTITKEEKPVLKVKTEEFVKQEQKEEKVPPIPQRKFNFPLDLDDDVSSKNNINRETNNREKNTVNNINTSIYNNNNSNKGNVVSRNVNVLKLEKEIPKKVSELYQKKEEERIKPKFKASPVISPVYGVLDKNYTKEEVKEKTDDNNTMKRPSKKVDFETVRKKAFGNLADEIKDNLLCENCELYKEVKKIGSLKEDDLLYDMTVDDDKEVTIEKAYDNYEEFGVAYEPKVKKQRIIEESNDEKALNEVISENDKEDDFPEIFSQMNDEPNEIIENDVKIISSVSDDVSIDTDIKEESEEIPSRQNVKKETKVDDDFFELIDSMYKERADD